MHRFACFLLLLSLLCARARAAEEVDLAGIEFFETKVRPLLVKRCYECHSQTAKKSQGGLLLDTAAGLSAGGDSGPPIVAGKPEESLLIEAVGYEDTLQMPPTGKLPEEEIAVLTAWVKRGAPLPKDGATVAKTRIDFAAGRKFWSFQPPVRHEPPAAAFPGWPAKPIDGFILAALEKQQLSPSPAADRRTLIRRASFDLIGLPPTPDEVARFVDDPAPDAYAQLIERLLASPQYGERWGRYWLDLARYTDKPASWDSAVAQAWLYRDWVVRALNDDLPYDEFVRRQLAADLTGVSAPPDLAALGFLGLSPTLWKELKLDHQVIKVTVAEEWEERIDAVGRTFLGLSLACARCHDHKFDPISNEDYYALAGVMAGTRLIERHIIPESAAAIVREAIAKVQALQAEVKKLEDAKPAPPENAAKAAELRAQIAELEKGTPNYHSPQAFAVDDAALYVLPDGPNATRLDYHPGEALDLAVQIRGNPANPGPVVPRRFLTVLSPEAPATFGRGSGRLDLANAIVTTGAPLSARVIVNRVWQHHFGRGLVETPSDFGSQGARPSHPELLDDLTARFIEHGWSLKWLHREIMLSATYQQASSYDAAKFAVDPDNRLLWRMPRVRLDVEAWRDAMLAVSGTLDAKLGGPAADLTSAENVRRTIYGRVDRYNLDDMLRLHDFPDALSHSPTRAPTTTALQQLFVLNSPFVQQQAAALANRLAAEHPGSVAEQVRRAYMLLFGREPTAGQLKLAVEFLTGNGSSAAPTAEAWREYAQVLLGSNEFMFVD